LVIHILNEIGNPFFDIFHGSVFPELDLLGFESFYETLSISIVVRVGLSGHADLKTVGLEFFDIVTRGILNTAI